MAKKPDPREARLRAGLAALAEMGVGPEAATIADLERARRERPDTALAVASLLGDRASGESLAALRGMEEGADKELRREIRRSLYRLSQRGFTAEPVPSAPVPSAPSLFAAAEPEGFLSASDPRGDRLFWILKPRAGGGLHHLSTVVNEPDGLREAVLAEVSRKAVRNLRAEIEERHGLRLFEVDWRYCDWIASEGYGRVRARGAPDPNVAAYPQLRLQLFQRAAEPVPPPIAALVDPEASADEASLAASAKLFEEPELRFWFLTEPVLAPYLERARKIRESPIVVERHQRLAQVDEIVGDAVREIFSGDAAASWRRRLEETAYVLWKSGREEAARRAVAAAAALRASAAGGRGIPFFEELARRTFGLFFAQEAEKEREERAGSVLVTPDQIREEQAHRHRR